MLELRSLFAPLSPTDRYPSCILVSHFFSCVRRYCSTAVSTGCFRAAPLQRSNCSRAVMSNGNSQVIQARKPNGTLESHRK
eukprot:1330437-Amphidinium_carterae.1